MNYNILFGTVSIIQSIASQENSNQFDWNCLMDRSGRGIYARFTSNINCTYLLSSCFNLHTIYCLYLYCYRHRNEGKLDYRSSSKSKPYYLPYFIPFNSMFRLLFLSLCGTEHYFVRHWNYHIVQPTDLCKARYSADIRQAKFSKLTWKHVRRFIAIYQSQNTLLIFSIEKWAK